MASSTVTCIFQDSRGYLWFGTQQGISRFDGREFKNYYMGEEFSNDYAWNIYEAPNGDLWFATVLGGVIRYREGSFKNFTRKHGLVDDHVFAIAADGQGKLWFGTFGGISVFDGKDFKTITREQGLVSNRVNDIAAAASGELWFGTWGGVSCYKKGKFTNYTTAEGLVENRVKRLLTDSRGNLWIGTMNGLSRYRDGKFYTYTQKDGLSGNEINALDEDRRGKIWIGTNGGLSYFSGGTFKNYNTSHGLPDNAITAVFEDKAGHIWLGCRRGAGRMFSRDIGRYTQAEGLVNNLVSCVLQDRQGRYWIGTGDGLSRIAGDRVSNYTVAEGLPGNNITTLEEDRQGNIWIGTDAGLGVLKGKTFHIYSMKHGLNSRYISALLHTADGITWVGTSRGLCRFEPKSGRFNNAGQNDFSSPVHALMEDTGGDLLLSDTRGLLKYSTGKGLTAFIDGTRLPHPFIYSLFRDSRARTWITTQGGLSCLEKGELRNFTTRDGLYGNICYFVLEDNRGDLWLGTPRGLNRMNGRTLRIYPALSSSSVSELSQKAYIKDHLGRIWFGTTDGVIRFNPLSLPGRPPAPPVYLSSWNVMGRPQNLTPGTHLSHHHKHMEFGFVGISYTPSTEITYRYRLTGGSGEWLETLNRSVSYAYLPPGKYSFEVLARDNLGAESLHTAKIDFKIMPPFWGTPWFRAAAVTSLVFMPAIFLAWRKKRIQEKILLRERGRQLVMAQKMELMGMLATGAVHDLKNLMTTIVGYSGMVAKNIDEKDKNIRFVDKIQRAASTAVRLSRQILTFTRQPHEQKRPQWVHLPHLLNEIVDILEITLPKPVTLTVELQSPGKALKYPISPGRFQQVVMNLCLNAVHAMPGGGTVTVSLCGVPRGVVLQVTDTGIGIEEEVRKKIFDPLYTTSETGKGSGLGLFVVKQIVDEHRGSIEISSTPGEGSRFRVFLPAPRKHYLVEVQG